MIFVGQRYWFDLEIKYEEKYLLKVSIELQNFYENREIYIYTYNIYI